MAISYATGGGVKEMTLWYNADSLTNWGGDNDGLEGNSAEIQGADCVIAALRKNENVTVTYTATQTGVPSGSQLILNFYTTIASIMTSITIDLNDGATGTANYNILPEFTAGQRITTKGFVPIALDLSAGNLNVPTNNLAGHIFNLDVQNVNVKTADNQYWDAAYTGDGITLSGTTVSDTLFAEAQAYDVGAADLFIGALQSFEGIIFSQHNVDINTTTGNSTNESLTFVETNNGTNSYTLGGTGTAVFTGTNIQSTGTVTFVVNLASMTAFTMTGGSIKNAATVTFASGQTISRASFDVITTLNTSTSTFNDNSLSTVTTANIASNSSGLRLTTVTTPNITGNLSDCTITTSGRVDLSSSGTLTTTTIDRTLNATSMVLLGANTGAISECSFLGEATNKHAVELSAQPTGNTISWNSSFDTNFAAGTVGVQGTDWTATANGDEAIYFNYTGSTDVTINVSGSGTVPSIRVAAGYTGTITIVSAVTNTITVIDADTAAISGAQVAVFNSTDNSVLFNAQTNGSGVATFSSGSGISVYIRVRKSTSGSTRYIPVETVGSTTGGISLTVTLTEDVIASA